MKLYPERMSDEFFDKLKEICQRDDMVSLRFSQMISNLIVMADEDIFHWEDDKLLKEMEKHFDKDGYWGDVPF